MKKNMKKMASVMLAGMMLSSMAMVSFADTAAKDGSITIQQTVEGKTYELYKIFDLTYSGTVVDADQDGDTDAPNLAYTIADAWKNFFSSKDGAPYISNTNTGGLNAITIVDDQGNREVKYINITESNKAEFSNAALAYAVTIRPDKTATGEKGDTGEQDDTVVLNDLPLGYYIIYPAGAADVKDGQPCLCSLTSTDPNETVVVKATYPTIEKTDDKVSADVGDAVTYTITGKVPDTTGYSAYEYTVNDTMSDGLTFNKDVAVMFGSDKIDITNITETDVPNASATVDYESESPDTWDFKLTFDMTKYQANKGEKITIVYSATVNDNAVAEVENNSATLTYTHNPEGGTTKTPAVEEKVYSSKIVIDKVDGSASPASAAKLEGAKFVLKNDNGEYYKYTAAAGDTPADVSWVNSEDDATEVRTNADGAAEFNGLKDGTYYLKETEAPLGYNLLENEVTVVVKGDESDITKLTVKAQVQNESGTQLPETGGMGTVLFYALGGGLMVSALALIALKKRENAEE